MAGQTETLSTTKEEVAMVARVEEEVVATAATGDQQSTAFVIGEAADVPMTESIAEKTVEVEQAGELENRAEELVAGEETVSATETLVANTEETIEETPMETEDIPSEQAETDTNNVLTHIENIPDETTSEVKGEEHQSVHETIDHIPNGISEEATESVHNETTPDDNSTEVFHMEEVVASHPTSMEEEVASHPTSMEEEVATHPTSPPPPYPSSILKSVVESTLGVQPTVTTRTTLGSSTIGSTVVPTLRTTVTHTHPPSSLPQPPTSQLHPPDSHLSHPPTSHLSHIPKPPLTDILLQTAREVLQLPEEPSDRGFLMGEPGLRLGQMAGPVVTETVISSGHQADASSITSMAGQRLSLEDEASQHMEDENATYILEPVTNEEYYQDDQNIMWIQETVEVEQQESYDSLPNMVIILNPNGTVNEELMLAHGMNLETIKAVTDNVINLQGELGAGQGDLNTSIKSLQHPIPRRDLIDVKPLFANQVSRTIVDNAISDNKQGLRSIVEGCLPVTTEHSRSVILDAKDNFLVLDELEGGGVERDPMIEPLELSQLDPSTHRVININGTNHVITSGRAVPDLKRYLPTQQLKDTHGQEMNFQVSNLSNLSLPMTPLGTLDLSLPKKQEPGLMEQYVNPAALVSENSVLKALSAQGVLGMKDPLTGKLVRPPGGKIRKPKPRDENGNGTPYIHRKTTSLGALGQALHGTMLGIPRDSRENAVQICPICKFQATTKNPYRHLQDHLARVHFKERIAADLPTKKPYICPMAGCDGKHYPDWQAVMRHYIGKKHGILDKFVKETLSEGLHAGML